MGMILNVRKKPFVIQAIQILENNFIELAEFVNGDIFLNFNQTNTVQIQLHEPNKCTSGDIFNALCGDWIIKGVYGEIYALHDDIFKETYEVVE